MGADAGYMCFGSNLVFLAWVLEADGILTHIDQRWEPPLSD